MTTPKSVRYLVLMVLMCCWLFTQLHDNQALLDIDHHEHCPWCLTSPGHIGALNSNLVVAPSAALQASPSIKPVNYLLLSDTQPRARAPPASQQLLS